MLRTANIAQVIGVEELVSRLARILENGALVEIEGAGIAELFQELGGEEQVRGRAERGILHPPLHECAELAKTHRGVDVECFTHCSERQPGAIEWRHLRVQGAREKKQQSDPVNSSHNFIVGRMGGFSATTLF